MCALQRTENVIGHVDQGKHCTILENWACYENQGITENIVKTELAREEGCLPRDLTEMTMNTGNSRINIKDDIKVSEQNGNDTWRLVEQSTKMVKQNTEKENEKQNTEISKTD